MRFPKSNRALIHRPIVWIVDRQRSDFDYLIADVQARQMQIRFFASGRELLHGWFAGAPDVCIVSLQLRDLGGFDVVEMIHPFPAGMVVCTLTDEYRTEDEVRALSLGVHSYLCKPLEKAVFFELCFRTKAKSETVRRGNVLPAVDYCRKAAKATRSIATPRNWKGGR
jgi:two-component system, OmpR family, response regulator